MFQNMGPHLGSIAINFISCEMNFDNTCICFIHLELEFRYLGSSPAKNTICSLNVAVLGALGTKHFGEKHRGGCRFAMWFWIQNTLAVLSVGDNSGWWFRPI